MNYKKISTTLKNIEKDFSLALNDFQKDCNFEKKWHLYFKKSKKNLKKKWKKISGIFWQLKSIIHKHKWFFFFKQNYNNFLIRHYTTILYYNFTLQIQETFKENEDFIRQFLDENYEENYSTLARYIYRGNFLYYLNYPKEFLFLIEKNIDKDLKWMLKKNIDYSIKLDFEYKNFYYYFKYRWDKIIYFIVKYFWLLLSYIRIKIREKWLINQECINIFYTVVKPWDILLTRQTFVATNLSIPGFWKHMALYLWTWKYIKNNFWNDTFKILNNETHYIIESTSKWVTIEKFEDFVYKLDYLWVLRTTFSYNKIYHAMKETISMLDKDYDYLFNYYSDNSFVCSELVTKAYLKDSNNDEWLTIELKKVATRLTYPPNELIKKLENEIYLENKELIPLLFIDSNQKTKTSFISSHEELLKSHKRNSLSFFLD